MNHREDIERLVKRIVRVLSLEDQDAAERFKRTPINPKNRYACLYRKITTTETAIRVRWGLRSNLSPVSRVAPIVECMDLLRTALTATLTSPGPATESWLKQIEERVETITTRLEGKNGTPSEEPTNTGRSGEVDTGGGS